MLGRISHWLATRHEDKGGAGDAFVQQRYDALVRGSEVEPLQGTGSL